MNRRTSVNPLVSFLFAALLACPAAVLAAPGDGGGGGGGGGEVAEEEVVRPITAIFLYSIAIRTASPL